MFNYQIVTYLIIQPLLLLPFAFAKAKEAKVALK